MRLFAFAHVAEFIHVHPAFIVLGNANQIRAKGFSDPFDLGRSLSRRPQVHLFFGHVSVQGKLVGKAFPTILVLFEFGEEVADMPGGIAQRIIFLGKAINLAPGFERLSVRFVE